MPKFIKRWQARRQCANSLHAMTDRELNDIGINSGDIRRIADQAAADWY